MKHQNIFGLFESQVARYGDRTVFNERIDDRWSQISWAEFGEKTVDFACALFEKGLTKGGSVAILAENSPEWTIAEIGTIAAGGVGVGILPDSSSDQCEFIIRNSEAQFVVVDTLERFENIKEVLGKSWKVKEVICLEKTVNEKEGATLGAENNMLQNRRVCDFDDFLSFGKQVRRRIYQKVEAIGKALKPADTAVMIYTGEKTSDLKGVMLSHQYILNSCDSIQRSTPLFETDVCVSHLSNCHPFERIGGLYSRLYNGTSCYFVDDPKKLQKYLQEIKPTVFASFPEYLTKMHAEIRTDIDSGKVNTDVGSRITEAFGGKVRLLTSVGACLPLEVAESFAAADLPILQTYGLTESICITSNTVECSGDRTAGKPMPMCEVKIAADGEILVKSPMMFSGYYNDPEMTAEMFDENGWLKTGDLGELNKAGFLTVTGRKTTNTAFSRGDEDVTNS